MYKIDHQLLCKKEKVDMLLKGLRTSITIVFIRKCVSPDFKIILQ